MPSKRVAIVASLFIVIATSITAFFFLKGGVSGFKENRMETLSGTSLAGTGTVPQPEGISAVDAAIASGNLASCEILEKTESERCKKEILTNEGRRKFSISPCSTLTNRQARTDCIKKVEEYVSAFAPEIGICLTIRNETLRNSCTDRLNIQLASFGNAQACREIKNEASKTPCEDSYLLYGVESGNLPLSACRKLKNRNLFQPCQEVGKAAIVRGGSGMTSK